VTVEQRVAALEKTAMDQAHELMAMDILLKSLIVSHPDPASLRTCLEALAANFSDQALEHGFSTGRKPQVAGAIASAIGAHISRWLQLLPAKG